jgi:hypothetical protein
MTVRLRRLNWLLAASFLALALLVAPLAARELGEAHLSARAMHHILARHGPLSHAADAGHFAPGTTPAQIRALIETAVREGVPHADTGNRPSTLYDYTFPEPIGFTAEGRPTRRLRVVVGYDGEVITAYPR